ncbi:LamG domain-containing protein [Arenibacter certesii]|nr:LamG domain-containing protein [Arenibacter certesii]
MLLVVPLIFINCNDKDRYDVIIDNRINEIGEVVIISKNPNTKQDYTSEELSLLDYNPQEEEWYYRNQPLEISIWTETKPLKIEIKRNGEQSVVQTIDEFSENNNGYSFNWISTIEDLDIDEGSLTVFNVVVIYDDAGVDGFDYNSAQAIPYTIYHKTAASVVPLVSLQRGLTDITPLNIESNVSGSGVENGIGAYVVLDGIDDLVTITDVLDFVNNSDFSVSLWVNTTTLGDDPSIIGNKDWSGGGNKGFILAHRGSKDIKLVGGDGVGGRLDLKGSPINDGNWHHIAMTFDKDGVMSLYLDGELAVFNDTPAAGDISTFSDMDSGLPIRIGQDGTGAYGQFFEGKVGGVVIIDYVLSSDEVNELYSGLLSED